MNINIRGIKSKLISLKEIIEVKKPTIANIQETHLGENEIINLSGYTILYNNKKEGKGGTAIAIKNEVFNKCVLIENVSENYEAIWIKISNNKNINLRIGNIYAPQESRTKDKEIENMYNNIRKHKLEADKNFEKIIISGDFNCKIGDHIKGNEKSISKFGKKLIKLITDNKISIINKSTVCEGLWTRTEGKNRSIIDYVLTSKEDEKHVYKMIIDENKNFTPFHIVKNRTIYTDHCTIIVKMNLYIACKGEHKENIWTVNKETLKKFKTLTTNSNLIKIAKEQVDIETKYSKWQNEVEKIMKICFVKKNKNKEYTNEKLIELHRMKRKVKIKYYNDKTKHRMYKIQNQLIKEYIIKETSRLRANRVNNEIRKLEKDKVIGSNAFWEFKKRMDGKRKIENVTAMLDKKGNLKTSEQDIRNIFHDFYSSLFETNEITEAKEMDNEIFNLIENIKSTKYSEEITINEITDCITKIKKKKTKDIQGWSNEILINSGKDITKSLSILFNQVDSKTIVPKEWKDLKVISIYKNKGKRNEMENRRGLFITNTISKLYEKIKLKKVENKIISQTSKYQCGGIKGKSTVDHIMTLNAIIDYNKYLNSETYILFADAYKCFDRLNLKNCIIDLYKAVGAKTAMEIYRLNQHGKAIIQAPGGKIGPVKADNLVRQGTIWGPTLCSSSVDKVNKIGRKCITIIGNNIKIEMLAYVDDINYATNNKKQLEKAVNNLRVMEKTKGFTFNIGASKTAILKIQNKKKSKELDIKKLYVKKGTIENTSEYKYLGEWYNEKGDHSTSIKMKKQKIEEYIRKLHFYGNEYIIGKYALEIRIKIYKTIVIPTVYHNIQTWSNISKSELKELEGIQGYILKRMCELPKTTPYIALLAELGIWTVEKQIEYGKITLLHNIMTSNNRLIKDIIKDQIENTWKGCWIEQVIQICEKYDIILENITTYTKHKLKEILKKKIWNKMQNELDEERKEKSKLRFITRFEKKEYIKKLNYKECLTMFKIRMNMIETKHNYKGLFNNNLNCEICKKEIDKTEHLFTCEKINRTKINDKAVINNIKLAKLEIATIAQEALYTREKMGFKVKIKDDKTTENQSKKQL